MCFTALMRTSELFDLLLTATGIGPKIAQAALAVLPPCARPPGSAGVLLARGWSVGA